MSRSPVLDGQVLLGLPPATRRRRELQALLYAVLERDGMLGRLDDKERAFARRGYYATLARSVRLREALLELLDDAAAEGVELLALKGSLLAFTLYPDPAMRPMGDLDLAVRARDVAPLVARLEARGARRVGVGRARYDVERLGQVILRTPAHVEIELHLELAHELGLDGDAEPLFDRAITVPSTLGRSLAAPSWEDHLGHIALHAATHAFADSPLWLFDLALIAPLVQDRPAVVAEAARRRGRAALHFAFALATRQLPALALAAPAPPFLALRAALLRLALGAEPFAGAPRVWPSRLARAALYDRPSDVLRSVVERAALRLYERYAEGISERFRR